MQNKFQIFKHMKKSIIPSTCITRIPTEQGESIEEMIRRCVATNEPIEATAPMIYTEEKDGALPEYNIRTDRFDLALDAVDKYQKSLVAKSQSTQKPAEESAQTESGDNGNAGEA